MSLTQLRYFVAVAEEGQVSRAARKLHVSQPPMSQRLKELESELGVDLFARTSRGMQLTPKGTQFLSTARHVLTELETGVQDLKSQFDSSRSVNVRMTSPHSREELISAHRAGSTFRFLPFYGHTAREPGHIDKSCLSQWFPCRFIVDGIGYSSTEQWMMAGKARLFGDDETLQRILSTEDPSKVKALGREVKNFDTAKWATHRFDHVARGNFEKFGQSPELRTFLLSTGDDVLVEAAPKDPIWGVGLGIHDPLISEPEKWKGLNLLGFALMNARERLRVIVTKQKH